MQPNCSMILQTCWPDGTRNLPNSHLQIGYKHFASQPILDLDWIRNFKE
ncbi:MAG: hypothetical protein RLZZ117_538 [Cyanobacteriota bacterium]|jgi:hypothetical protein